MTSAHQASLPITNSCSLFRLISIASVMPSNHLILCHPLLLPPSIFLSMRVFSDESVLHIMWPMDWNLNFSISPSNEYSNEYPSNEYPPSEYSGLISFRIDGLDLLAVHGRWTSPTPQFKRVCSLVLSLLYSLTLTSIHDHWKNHSFD